MSFEAMTWAVSKKLPCQQKIVLLMLANRCNADTGRCDPSHKRLAEDCGMSVDSVKRAINTLSQLELLRIVHRSQDGVQLPNQYMLELGSAGLELDRLQIGGVGADSTGGWVHTALGVGADSTTKQEFKQEVKTEELSTDILGQQEVTKGKQKPASIADLLKDLPDDLARDFIQHRKTLKAPITQTAVEGIRREAKKASLSFEDAVRHIIERGWRGFKAEWVTKDQPVTAQTQKSMGSGLPRMQA